MRKHFLIPLWLVVVVAVTSGLASAANETLPQNQTGEEAPLDINVSVASSQNVCLFFGSAPSFVPRNEQVLIHTINVNCGNQPVNATTSITIENSTGSTVESESADIELENRLEEIGFNLFFSTSVPNGTYTAVAETTFNETEVNTTKTFDVVREAQNLTRRITVFTPRRRIVRLSMSFTNDTMNISRGNTLLAPVEIRNQGTVTLRNLSIRPTVPLGWNRTAAHVNSLRFNDTVTRRIGLTPSKDVRAARHIVQARAVHNGDTLDTGFLFVEVFRSGRKSLKLPEFPVSFTGSQQESKNFSVIVENDGNISLHDVSVELENEESCVFPSSFPSVRELPPRESEVITTDLIFKNNIQTCNATVIATSEEGASETVISTVKVEKRAGFPALLLNRSITFVTENPLLVILVIVLIVVGLRVFNYVRYNYLPEEVLERTS